MKYSSFTLAPELFPEQFYVYGKHTSASARVPCACTFVILLRSCRPIFQVPRHLVPLSRTAAERASGEALGRTMLPPALRRPSHVMGSIARASKRSMVLFPRSSLLATLTPRSRVTLNAAPLCSLTNKNKILGRYHVRRFPQASATAVESLDDEIKLTRRAVHRGRQSSSSSSSPSPRSSSPQAPTQRVVRFIVPEFVTAPGQIVALVGSSPALGNWDASRAVRLAWQDGHRWAADVHLQPGWSGALEFKLALIDGACAVWEPGRNRLLVVDKPSSTEAPLEVVCCWASCGEVPPTPSLVHASHLRPLPHSLLPSRGPSRGLGAGDTASAAVTVLLPLPTLPGHVVLSPGAQMVLTGSSPELGNWDPSRGLLLSQHTAPGGMPGFSYTGLGQKGGAEAEAQNQQLWTASVRLPLNKLIEAKVAVIEAGKPIQWEAGPNRSILLSPTPGAYIRPPTEVEVSSSQDCSTSPEAADPGAQPGGASRSYTHPSDTVGHSLSSLFAELDEATAASDGDGTVGAWGDTGPVDGSAAAAATSVMAPNSQSSPRGSAAAAASGSSALTGRSGGYRVRGRGGRSGSSSAELAELLGVVDSDDEDSRFDDDGRPRGASGSGAAADASNSPRGGDGAGAGTVHVLNNILSLRRGELHVGASGSGSDGAAAEVAASGRPSSRPPRAQQRPDPTPTPAPASIAAPPPAFDPPPVPAPSPSLSGGDYVVMLHWGCPSCSRAIYRPPLPPDLPPRSECSTATTALVHLTVPLFTAQQGQQLIVTGSSPQLGGWDPAKGLQLKWGPGHRWTGHLELPMEMMEFKVVLYSRGQYMWEPGSNRRVDLGGLVAEGSSTGAGEVHLACSWGLGPSTAALVVPLAPPAVVMEVMSGRSGPESGARMESEGTAGGAEAGEGRERGGEGTTVVLDSVRDRDQSESLIKLLSFALSSLMAPGVAEGEGAATPSPSSAAEGRCESEEVEGLKASLASRQCQVEELQARLEELAAEGEQQRSMAAAAEAMVAEARAAAAEAAAGLEAEAAARQQRHVEEVGTLRSGYESRILELQQQYESRILYLQQHESRMLGLQQQHSQELAKLEALHQQVLSEVKAALQQQEDVSRRLQRSQQLSAKQHEAALKREQEHSVAVLHAMEEEHLSEVARLERGNVRDTDALLARIQDVEVHAAQELQLLQAEHTARLQAMVREAAAAAARKQDEALARAAAAAQEQRAADAAAAAEEASWLRLQLQQVASERDLLLLQASEGRHALEQGKPAASVVGMPSPWLHRPQLPRQPSSYHWWSGSEHAASPPTS